MSETQNPGTSKIGLKEWDVVRQALEMGRQTILLRKGGIYESAGEFQVEHERFLLFPTFLHQSLKMLKPEAHSGFQQHAAEPAKITLSSFATVSDIFELKQRRQMDALDSEQIWTPPLIDMRFNYRPENPLYLVVVRAYRLKHPVTVENTPAYAGCKSWVPLEQAVDVSGAAPALDDASFARRRGLIISAVR
ncbi:MAG TPA: DUF1802 family protein [Tepidisphaeraceae bacterium]|jgi:hypothetical protein